MQIIELIIDETEEVSGIEAISIVSAPAIEEGFIALKNEEQVRLAEVDKDKRLLIGAALIPDKTIYRKTGDEEFYIYFYFKNLKIKIIMTNEKNEIFYNTKSMVPDAPIPLASLCHPFSFHTHNTHTIH